MKQDIEKLRKKYIDNPPEGMTSGDIRHMSGDELLDMDYFLNEDDLFDRNPYIVLVLPFNHILHNAFMPADIKDYHISNELVYGFHISVFSSANTKCTFRRCLLSSLRHNPAQSCIIRHWCDPTCNSGTHKILSR